MNWIAIFLGAASLILFCIFLFLFLRQQQQWRQWIEAQSGDQSFDILTRWLHDMRGSIDQQTVRLNTQLELNNQAIGNRLDNAARVISSISRELGQVQEI
ncbi:hypothetical protein JXJ21_20315, partial [candidate division KSB1 bacterium]|nr:hypothetical protein [candidate division KSB1 bacterium]